MIEPGQLTMLRCGGPQMVVDEVCGDEISCVWHDRDDKLNRSSFSSHCLQFFHTVGQGEVESD